MRTRRHGMQRLVTLGLAFYSFFLNPVLENLEPFLIHDRIALDDNVFVGE